jgi:hypothetical protein
MCVQIAHASPRDGWAAHSSPLIDYWMGITWFFLPTGQHKFKKHLEKKSRLSLPHIPPVPTVLPFVISFPDF